MPSSQPNVLVLFADQLRRNALGCYGNPDVSTPYIDALAARGTRCDAACSTFPVCVPFRFSLLTGEYAHTRFVPTIEWRMSPAEYTLADAFNADGYETAWFGKWHLHGGHGILPHHSCERANLTPVPKPFRGRFQTWRGFELANAPFATRYFIDDDPMPYPVPGYQTDGMAGLLIDWFAGRAQDASPFFAVWSVEPPHFPLEAPAAYADRWRDRPVTLPPHFLVPPEIPDPDTPPPPDPDRTLENLRTYYAMIENLDDNVGRIIAGLDQAGLADNTIVVLISDHGQMDGAHAKPSTAKARPYEESIGVPLIVHDPRDTGGRTFSTPTCTEDLFPTLLGLAGLPARPNLPGLDLSPWLTATRNDLPGREGVLLELNHHLDPGTVFHHTYWRGWRTRRWKYTVQGGSEYGGRPWQLFDLYADPGEGTNLINDPTHAATAEGLHAAMKDRMAETHDHFWLAPAWGQSGLNDWTKHRSQN
jgi:arylsulfatase A-like enzyme